MNAVAVATAVAAALLFGVSPVADQRSTKRVKATALKFPDL
jgi:hypothetical protein